MYLHNYIHNEKVITRNNEKMQMQKWRKIALIQISNARALKTERARV